MARNADFYIERATTAFNAGFSSKAGQKEALSHLNRAYERLRDAAFDAIRTEAFKIEDQDARRALFDKNDLPFDLHQVRDRHLPIFDQWTHNSTMVVDLMNLRETIKAAEITPPVRIVPSTYEVKARETLMELIERRQTQYLEAVNLGEIFGGLPVYANTHRVVNEHNTAFLRTFFYLRGKLTPLNVIIAAAQELERRKEAAQ